MWYEIRDFFFLMDWLLNCKNNEYLIVIISWMMVFFNYLFMYVNKIRGSIKGY